MVPLRQILTANSFDRVVLAAQDNGTGTIRPETYIRREMEALRPHSVLIVEDEGLVCLMLEDLLRQLGACVVDVFAGAAEALHAASTRPYDLAILDIVLRDGTSTPVADVLDARGVPFFFSSGVGLDAVAPRHRARRLVPKPFADETITAQILDLLDPA